MWDSKVQSPTVRGCEEIAVGRIVILSAAKNPCPDSGSFASLRMTMKAQDVLSSGWTRLRTRALGLWTLDFGRWTFDLWTRC